jgi:hypothetical protein
MRLLGWRARGCWAGEPAAGGLGRWAAGPEVPLDSLVYCLESPDLPDGVGLDDVAMAAVSAPVATAPWWWRGSR